MITINEIASQKLYARKLAIKSQFITELYNEILWKVSNDSNTDYFVFSTNNLEHEKLALEVIQQTIDDDFYVKKLVKKIEHDNDEEYGGGDITVYFDINYNL